MTDEPTPLALTGGCRCGRVRYVGHASSPRSVVCACKDCQRSSGAFLSVAVGVRAEGFDVIRGEDVLRSYADMGESGQPVNRYFCGHCGSPLFARPESYAHVVSVRAVSLDEPHTSLPAFGIFEEHIPGWIELPDVDFSDG